MGGIIEERRGERGRSIIRDPAASAREVPPLKGTGKIKVPVRVTYGPVKRK